MTKTEEAIRAAVVHLKKGPRTCSELGSMLWGNGYKKPQSYARPAGKLLHKMERDGLVYSYFDKFHQHFMWKLRPGADAE